MKQSVVAVVVIAGLLAILGMPSTYAAASQKQNAPYTSQDRRHILTKKAQFGYHGRSAMTKERILRR